MKDKFYNEIDDEDAVSVAEESEHEGESIIPASQQLVDSVNPQTDVPVDSKTLPPTEQPLPLPVVGETATQPTSNF